jgi:hypothetical protein
VPPVVERVDPPAGSVGVAVTQPVTLLFSKPMNKDGVEPTLHFFPPPPSPPRLRWEGRQLLVTPDTAWDSGQTYVVTLQSEASDRRGNRLAATFQSAFSTGQRMDTGRIEGQILSGARPRGGALALCYRLPRERANPETDTADYVVQTDSAGRFTLSFLGPGNYRIFGLADQDGDWLWNIGSEDIAVPAQDVGLEGSGAASFLPALHLSDLDTSAPAFVACRPLSDTWWRLEFDGPLDSAALNSARVQFIAGEDTAVSSLLLSVDSLSSEVLARQPAPAAPPDEILWSRSRTADVRESCAPDSPSSDDTTHALPPPEIRPDTVAMCSCRPDQMLFVFARPLDSLQQSCFWPVSGVDSIQVELANAFEFELRWWADARAGESTVVAVAPGAVVGAGRSWPLAETLYVRLPLLLEDSTGGYELACEGLPVPPGQPVRVQIRPVSGPALPCRIDLTSAARASGRLAKGDYLVSLLADRDGNGRWAAGWPEPFVPSERLWFPSDTLRVRARFTTEFDLALVR